jgi:hypothetical protein
MELCRTCKDNNAAGPDHEPGRGTDSQQKLVMHGRFYLTYLCMIQQRMLNENLTAISYAA